MTTMYVPPPPVQVHLNSPAASGGGLAVLGAVLAGFALVVALLALAVSGLSAFFSAGATGGGYGLRGTIAPARGGDLSGPVLAEEVAAKVTEDGGDPEGITCPSTAKVTQNVTTICHGLDFGITSAFVVFFEDENGAYTLLEI